jgi:hypothetical protein
MKTPGVIFVALIALMPRGDLARAQPSITAAPSKGSTGPTVDRRPVEQGQLGTPAGIPANTAPKGPGGRAGSSMATEMGRTDKP